VLAAQIAEARDGPESAMALLGAVFAELPERRWMLVGEPASTAWLTRVAVAAGDRANAELAVTTAEGLARDNPEFPTVVAAAAHARGLYDGDTRALASAAEVTDPQARASAAEDLGVLLTEAGDRVGAVRRLGQALAGYEETGAARDAARVRQRLRRMGVRHRHWAYADRPVSGWESLTDTERVVSRLVAEGQTNRQVAARLFVSVHTVAFHLRQVFRKLAIGSRVELTRLALEHDRRADPPQDLPDGG
jgi:DNA-binding CsgD family transcriptional regulator